MSQEAQTVGLVANLERGSTVDGPGVRTVVFLKGCALTCPWCHNPETISPRPELLWEKNQCLNCGQCRAACPQPCFRLTAEGFRRDDPAADCALACAQVCPTGALIVSGQLRTAREVLEIAERDRRFYAPDGGLTISGGEPLRQPAFVKALARLGRNAGFAVALDSTACAPWPVLAEIAPEIDLFIGDLKIFDSEEQRRQTGVPAELIRENLRRLDALGVRLWLRTPLIPGFTDEPGNLARHAEFASGLHCLERYELLPYNPLAEVKYARLGRKYRLAGASPTTPAALAQAKEILRAHNLPCP